MHTTQTEIPPPSHAWQQATDDDDVEDDEQVCRVHRKDAQHG